MRLGIKEQEAINFEATSVVDDLRSLNPLTILQQHLNRWAPRDARLSEDYQETHHVLQFDNIAMVNLFEGMQLSVISKIPKENSLIIGVFLPTNSAEHERYYSVLDQRQAEWERHGSLEDILDPVSGDIHEIPPLAGSNPPRPKRALYARLRVSLEIQPESFVLSFAAWDHREQVLFYDVIEHANMDYLMRRMMHELFGNHQVKGNTGAFLEGISYLFQGNKLKLCQDHPKPSWLKDVNYKTSNPELVQYKAEAAFFSMMAFIFRYIFPVTLFIYGVLVNTWESLALYKETDSGDPLYLQKLLGSLVFAVISFKISHAIDRYVSVLNQKSKLA